MGRSMRFFPFLSLFCFSIASPLSPPNAASNPSSLASKEPRDSLLSLAKPTSVEEAIDRLASIAATKPSVSGLIDLLQLNALTIPVDAILDPQGEMEGGNSMENINPNPPSPIYPRKKQIDPAYSVTEERLRGAIHIPPSFTYGRIPPVILIPGTGYTGYTTYGPNLIPLLVGSSFADPVWLNIPGNLLDDVQLSGEYVAYAINYISSLTSTNVTTVGWSQGNLDHQWAMKYWPSTRSSVTSHVALAADYDGFLLANVLCLPGVPCAASVIQQRYLDTSNFITTLHKNHGDSAFVPTTALYSSLLDEIVQPQAGTVASGYIEDFRGVGVKNYEYQQVCAGQLAGSVVLHEGALYNPLSLAMIKDVIANGGPADISRLDLGEICGKYLSDGLGLDDLLATETMVVLALAGFAVHFPKLIGEPAIKAYAL